MLRIWVGILIWLACSGPGSAVGTQQGVSLSQQALRQTHDLNTDWDFIGPDGRHFSARVPDKWEALYGRRLPLYGTGTYSLRVHVPATLIGQNLKLYTDSVSGDSFRAYVNGQLVGHNGFYAGSRSRLPQFQPFKVNSQTLEISFVVDNQILQWSGLIKPIWIGTAPEIDQRIYRYNLQLNLVFGIFAFLAFFHLILFFFHRKDRAVLWFGLLCMSTCLYMEFFTVHNLEYLLGDIPLDVNARLLRLGLYGLLPCFFWYARSLSTAYVSARFVSFITWLNLGFMLTLLLPGRIQNPLLNLWLLVMGACLAYNTWLLKHSFKDPSVRPFVYSGLLYSVTVANDILNAFSLLHTGYFTRYGFLVFCLTQSGFLGWRLQKTFKQSLQLRADLEVINHNLEGLVDARTQEVNQKNDQLNQLLSFKEEMVEMLVHDLKTPLNVLLSLPDQQGGPAEGASVQAASLRMKTLIESLLDVNQGEQADLALQLSTRRLSDLVQRVSTVLQPWALSKGIQIANLVDSGHWAQIDAFLFERVIQNLLDNAIKHAPFGSEIRISSSIEGQWLCLDMLDAGPGMSDEVRKQALEKYQSFAQGGTAKSSGLGLYFCQRVVQAHQGELTLMQGPDGGTLVRIQLLWQSQTQAPDLAWQPAQIEALAPYARRLAQVEVYKISELKPLLKQLDALSDPQIQVWLKALSRAIKEVNETSYRELIAQITPDPDRR